MKIYRNITSMVNMQICWVSFVDLWFAIHDTYAELDNRNANPPNAYSVTYSITSYVPIQVHDPHCISTSFVTTETPHHSFSSRPKPVSHFKHLYTHTSTPPTPPHPHYS